MQPVNQHQMLMIFPLHTTISFSGTKARVCAGEHPEQHMNSVESSPSPVLEHPYTDQPIDSTVNCLTR